MIVRKWITSNCSHRWLSGMGFAKKNSVCSLSPKGKVARLRRSRAGPKVRILPGFVRFWCRHHRGGRPGVGSRVNTGLPGCLLPTY